MEPYVELQGSRHQSRRQSRPATPFQKEPQRFHPRARACGTLTNPESKVGMHDCKGSHHIPWQKYSGLILNSPEKERREPC